MYSTTRWFYPRGTEGEAMNCTFKDFPTLEKAVAYCRRYATGLRFAGVEVEDASGKIVFRITSDFNEEVIT